jgi:DNA polymerase III delta subunit
MSDPHRNAHYIAQVKNRIRLIVARQYPAFEKDLEKMSSEGLLEMLRMFTDVAVEIQRAKNEAIRNPFRR